MSIALSILFIILVALSVLDYFRIERKAKLLLLCYLCPILILIITFRYGVPDYGPYEEIFSDVSFSGLSNKNTDVHGEFGYLYLNYIVKILGGNVKIVFFIVACFSIALTALFYKKYTEYFLVAFLIYFSHIFLLREMIQVRSGLAIAIVMFSIPYLTERKFKKFLGITLIASLFHAICLLFIFIYIAYPYLVSSKNQIILLLAGLVLGLIFNIDVIQKILTLLNVPQIVLDYAQDDEYNFKLGLLNPVLLKQILVLVILYNNRAYLDDKVPHFNTLVIIYTVGVFWYATFNSFAILSARIATMFSNVEHVLIPSLLLLQKYRLITYLLILVYSAYIFFSKWGMLSTWSFSF